MASVNTSLRCGGLPKIRIPARDGFVGKCIDHFLNDSFLLGMLELRIHRQRQDFHSSLLGHWKIPLLVPQSRIGSLKVERRRVVDLSGDVRLREIRLNAIPILDADHIEVVDSLALWRFVRQNNSGNARSEQLIIATSNCCSSLIPLR